MGVNAFNAKSVGTTMVDSESKQNYKQDTADNVASIITADDTEASIPSNSNIIVSKEQLGGKEKSKCCQKIMMVPKLETILYFKEGSVIEK